MATPSMRIKYAARAWSQPVGILRLSAAGATLSRRRSTSLPQAASSCIISVQGIGVLHRRSTAP
jgi:hypothetical protein